MVHKQLTVKSHDIRTTVLISLGTALEYYDFAIFGMMARYLADVFFSSEQFDSAIVFVYLMFSLAYFARPLGGLIFGIIGDNLGRKFSLLLVTLIMALSTMAIGLLPSHHSLGILSGIFLALLRFLQGLSYGAELPGVLVIVAERTSLNLLASRCSIVMSITGLGAVLGTLVLYLLSLILDYESIVTWGWRLPFILGGILAVVSYYLRLKIVDAIPQAKPQNALLPLKRLLLEYPCSIVLGVLLTSFFSCLVLLEIYFIAYFPQNYAYEMQEMYFVRIISRTMSSFSLIFFGFVVDKIGSIKMLVYTLTAFILATIVYVMFDPLQSGSLGALIIFLCSYETLLVAYIAAFIPLIIRFFDASVSFTGMAICYNFSFALAALVPKLSSQMVYTYDEPLVIFILPVSLALLVLSVLAFVSKQVQRV